MRAVRGATRVDADEREHVLERSRELVRAVLTANELGPGDVLSVIFSATKDVRSVAPALAARQLGLHEPALLCVQEMDVEGAMTMVIRVLAHITPKDPDARGENVYLHGTETLRADVPPVPDHEQ